MSAVFDSDILIDVLRGIPAAEKILARFAEKRKCCSVVTIAELSAGTMPQEEGFLQNFLNKFHIFPVDSEIAWQGGAYMRRFSKRHGILLPDALIAATAYKLKVPLLTRNIKHFPMDDIQVVKPY